MQDTLQARDSIPDHLAHWLKAVMYLQAILHPPVKGPEGLSARVHLACPWLYSVAQQRLHPDVVGRATWLLLLGRLHPCHHDVALHQAVRPLLKALAEQTVRWPLLSGEPASLPCFAWDVVPQILSAPQPIRQLLACCSGVQSLHEQQACHVSTQAGVESTSVMVHESGSVRHMHGNSARQRQLNPSAAGPEALHA